MPLDAGELAQIKALVNRTEELRRAVWGVPPKTEGLQAAVTRIDGKTQFLSRLVIGDAELEHAGLRGQLASLSGRMSKIEEQLGKMIEAREAEVNQQKGMLSAFRVAGGLLGSSLLLQLAQLLGLIQP